MRLAALLLLLPAAGSAAVGAQTLRRPVSARVAGLSEAFVAMAGGVSSLAANPAGMTAAKRPELETSFMSGVLDDNFGWAGFALPAGPGVAGAGVTYYDAGKVELVFPGGAVENRTAARDFVGTLAWAMDLGGGLSAGVAGKAFRFELAEEADARGAAFDAGVRWKTPVRGLTVGASVQNAGPGYKFEAETENLPTTGRAGIAWALTALPERDVEATFSRMSLTLLADGVKVRDEETAAALGAEASVEFGSTTAALRVGGLVNREGAGPSFGAGIREGRFGLDYAMANRRQLGATHHVSLGFRF